MISIEITDKLYKDIETFCKVNNIGDIKKFCGKMLLQGFTIEKYGVSPFAKTTVLPKTETEISVENKEQPKEENNPNTERKKPSKVKIIKK